MRTDIFFFFFLFFTTIFFELGAVPCTEKVLDIDLLNKRNEWIISIALAVPERQGPVYTVLAQQTC